MKALIVILLTLCINSYAQNQFTFYAPLVEPIYNVQGTGIFDIIFKQAIDRAKVSASIIKEPYARALKSFKSNPQSCYLAGNSIAAKQYLGIDTLDINFVILNNPIMITNLKGDVEISNLNQLLGKTVSHLRGDDPKSFNLDNISTKYLPINSPEQSFRLLKRQRVFAILAAKSDLLPYLNELNQGLIIYNMKEGMICHKSEIAKQLLTRMKRSLENMKQDGSLKEALGNLTD